MSECNHDCSHCQSDCASRTAPQSLVEKPNALSSVKKVIGIVSGKGGVGKSLVTSMLAVLLNRRGLHTPRSWTPTSPAPRSPSALA